MSESYGPEPPPTPGPPGPRPDPKSIQVNLPNIVDLYANAVYFHNQRIYRAEVPSSLPVDVISHVFYAFARVAQDGTVYLSDPHVDTQLPVDGAAGGLGAFAALRRRRPNLAVLLSIGGSDVSSDIFSAVAADPVARERFGRSARDLVRAYFLSGVDVNWEHPTGPVDASNYLSLLTTVRQFLQRPAYFVTSALAAAEWALRDIDFSRVQGCLDHINLMAYDFSGPWTPVSGHQAQLHRPPYTYPGDPGLSGHSAVDYLISRGVQPEKILLGVPVYGRSFPGADNIGQSYTGHGGPECTFDYKDLPRPGSVEHQDAQAGAAFCVGGDGGFVSYDTPDVVRMKGTYVVSRGLGGLFYWTGTADAPGRRSLVKAGYAALHPGPLSYS